MHGQEFVIRNATASEFKDVGRLMVDVYARLEGFPKQEEQPGYYEMLASVGEFTRKPGVELLVAVSPEGTIAGAVVYFADMQYYGSGGIATNQKNAAGFRLLAVDDRFRGKGIGRSLVDACIRKASASGQSQVIIHSTRAMQTAWKMYERIGFRRSVDLDFLQGDLPVYGFRLFLQ